MYICLHCGSKDTQIVPVKYIPFLDSAKYHQHWECLNCNQMWSVDPDVQTEAENPSLNAEYDAIVDEMVDFISYIARHTIEFNGKPMPQSLLYSSLKEMQDRAKAIEKRITVDLNDLVVNKE